MQSSIIFVSWLNVHKLKNEPQFCPCISITLLNGATSIKLEMADETVMYQSLLLLGMLTFGAFALTLNNFQDRAETNVLETNLSETLADIGSKILDLIERGDKLRGNPGSSSFELVSVLNLPNEIGNQNYMINATSEGDFAVLAGLEATSETVVTTYFLGFNVSQIAFSGTIVGNNVAPELVYRWDGSSYSLLLRNS